MTAVFDVTSPADGDPAAGPADGDPGGGTHQATRRRRARSRPLRLVLYGGLVLALVGLAAGAVGIGGHHNDQPTRTNLPPTTARITRQTLVDYQEVDGTVDYRNQVTITAKAHGTVTWLPAVGDRIGRGKPVCRIDNKPIVLLYGALPPYRPLHPDVKGPDVRQFEENLRALGYTGFTVDDECSAATETAVKKWQKDLGLDQTSVVDPAAAMVAPRRDPGRRSQGHAGRHCRRSAPHLHLDHPRSEHQPGHQVRAARQTGRQGHH